MKNDHHKSKASGKKKNILHKKSTYAVLIILALIIAVRIALPYFVLNYVNKKLTAMHGYYGHVQDIDLALYRGAYKIKNIYLHKTDSISGQETDFFEAQMIDLSVEWKALLDGKIVGELEFDQPRLRFTKDKAEPKQIQKDTTDFRRLLDGFMPLRVNRFEISDGVIQYIDEASNPKVNIQMDNTQVIAENLTNAKDISVLPSTIDLSANIYRGTLKLKMKLNPLAKDPTFDLNSELNDTYLPDLNNFFKAYGKFDVNKGTFGLYSEVAAKDGKFIGYVKPLIKNLDVLGAEDRKDNILQQLWEGIVGGAGVILRNQKHDQVATKIPLEGSFKNTKANIWVAVVEVLQNAFIEALHPSIDEEINIASVGKNASLKEKITGSPDTKTEPAPPEKKKGFLSKLFGKKEKKDEPKK